MNLKNKSKKYSINIMNLAKFTNVQDLKKLFSQFGKVTNARINTDPILFRSKGSGSIQMNDIHSANNSIEKLNGTSFMGKIISVTCSCSF